MIVNIPFHKMHGLGNDFVILDARGGLQLDRRQIGRLADRRRGVGCDQVLVLRPSASADIAMDIYNADGSTAGACGNGTRCVARLIMDERSSQACIIETRAKLLSCKRHGADIEVDMGAPLFGWRDIPLAGEADTSCLEQLAEAMPPACAISMGNPHAVFFVDNANAVNIENVGPLVENHPLFPERTNVEFAQIMAPDRIRMRVWERGAGITAACGSGACATLVAAVRRGLSNRKAAIELDGGELTIEWRETDKHVLMTGPATYVYCARMDL